MIERVLESDGGDREAWEALLTPYQDMLYAICVRMVGSEQAGDLLQDAMVKIIQGLGSFDARSKLSTWMTRVTMNVCYTHLRSEKYRRHARLTGTEHESDGRGRGVGARSGAGGEHEPGSPVQSLEQKLQRDLVRRGLDALPDDQRGIVILRDLHGLEYEQIADVLGLNVGTVKSRLFRARAALRERIEAMENPPQPDLSETNPADREEPNQ